MSVKKVIENMTEALDKKVKLSTVNMLEGYFCVIQ